MDVTGGLADTISLIQPLNLFNRFLILTGVTPVLATGTLLVYLQRTVKQKGRERVGKELCSLEGLHYNELQHNPRISAAGLISFRVLSLAFHLPFVIVTHSLPSV